LRLRRIGFFVEKGFLDETSWATTIAWKGWHRKRKRKRKKKSGLENTMDDSKIKDFSFENLFFFLGKVLTLLFYTLFLRHIEMWTFGYNKKKSMLETTMSLFDDSSWV
jgi:hypothetical protein